jgi:Mn-dependent DtxR family transcriptional regulator
MNWDKIKLIDQYIRKKKTGNSKKIAKKLKISERSFFNYLKIMKSMGAKIYFNKSKNRYCYKRKVKFFVGFIKTK